jgi:hypothetical protein
MIVALLRSEPSNEKSFYVPPSEYLAGQLAGSEPRWFAQADFNGDGDVSRREFLGSFKQFAELDANNDSFISPDEAGTTAATTATNLAPGESPEAE